MWENSAYQRLISNSTRIGKNAVTKRSPRGLVFLQALLGDVVTYEPTPKIPSLVP